MKRPIHWKRRRRRMVLHFICMGILIVAFVYCLFSTSAADDERSEAMYRTYLEESTPEPSETHRPWTKFNVPLDDSLQRYIFDTCSDYGVAPSIVMAQIGIESNYKSDAIGDNGNSFGLMQIYRSCHLDRMKRLGVTDLLDPKQNVLVGIDLMSELIGYGNGIEWALSYYTGMGGADCEYSRRVLSDAEQLLEGVMVHEGGV